MQKYCVLNIKNNYNGLAFGVCNKYCGSFGDADDIILNIIGRLMSYNPNSKRQSYMSSIKKI